jgi:hypothetical protein
MKTTGIIIFALGLALTIYTSIDVFTKAKVVDIGKIEITRNKPHYYSWSPMFGIAVMVIGGAILARVPKK